MKQDNDLLAEVYALKPGANPGRSASENFDAMESKQNQLFEAQPQTALHAIARSELRILMGETLRCFSSEEKLFFAKRIEKKYADAKSSYKEIAEKREHLLERFKFDHGCLVNELNGLRSKLQQIDELIKLVADVYGVDQPRRES